MSVTIGSVTLSTLIAQPFGYDESDTSLGQTARRFSISGLATPSEWLDLLNEYDTWRDLRIQNSNPIVSNSVGTTVSFSGSGPGSQTWSSIPCWFISTPAAEQRGSWLAINVELIDAAQALQVAQRQIETRAEISYAEAQAEEDAQPVDENGDPLLIPNFGTYTVGSTVLKLTKPPDAFGEGPSVEFTITGINYITGPSVAYQIKDLEGTTDLAGWNAIRSWYATQIASTPSSGDFFPTTAPSATAERKLIDGVPTDIYTVSLVLTEVI